MPNLCYSYGHWPQIHLPGATASLQKSKGELPGTGEACNLAKVSGWRAGSLAVSFRNAGNPPSLGYFGLVSRELLEDFAINRGGHSKGSELTSSKGRKTPLGFSLRMGLLVMEGNLWDWKLVSSPEHCTLFFGTLGNAFFVDTMF